MALSHIAVRRAKPIDKPFKLADGGGMYLLVHPNGSKYWRFKYRFGGKEKTLALGIYPHIPLIVARDKRDDAKRLLASGYDPGEQKQIKKIEDRQRSANTFEAVAREWLTKQAVTWTPKSTQRITRLLERNIFPSVGGSPIAQVTAAGFLTSLQKIEMRGNFETAHRAMQICGRIFRYAIATGRAQADLSLVLKGALTPVREKHHASITNPKHIKDLLVAMEGYSGAFITRMALRLSPLLFVRPGELRHAEWSEIDLNAAEWRIAAGKMKMKAVHLVPLSAQALLILRELQPHTGGGRYLFPGVRTPSRPMSENTVNAALRRLGYDKNEMTGHGFRSMASTILHEQGWPHEAIERQLAHAERSKVSAAYNYAEHLPKRRKMMQAWSDYLESLTIGNLA